MRILASADVSLEERAQDEGREAAGDVGISRVGPSDHAPPRPAAVPGTKMSCLDGIVFFFAGEHMIIGRVTSD